jgi:shikimate dehydrogenase
MHTAAYRALGLDWEYTAIDVAPADLAGFLAGVAAEGFAGVNVTIPHKGAAVGLCDELSAEARRCESVNTVLVRQGGLRGETTDGAGLLWALGEVAPADALVLGAGGAAPARPSRRSPPRAGGSPSAPAGRRRRPSWASAWRRGRPRSLPA